MNPKGYSSQTNMQPLRYLNAAALNHVQSIFAYTTGYRVRQQRGCIFAGCTKSRPHGRCTARHGGAYSTTKLAASKLGGVEGLARPTGSSRGRAACGKLVRRNLAHAAVPLAVPLPAPPPLPSPLLVSCTPFCVVTLTNHNRLWLSLSKTAASVDSSA